ncbi:MAG: hypothetical protein COA33_007780 [Fluviicola sp.]|nr:hypothetical protein [Fluviicola sp.]
MKNIHIVIVSILLSSSLYSQEVDSRLLKNYSSEELSELITTDSDKYNILVLAIENGIEILDFPSEKSKKVTQEIELPAGKFSYLDLGLKIEDSNQYFRIKDTDKILYVKSFFVLKNELNK